MGKLLDTFKEKVLSLKDNCDSKVEEYRDNYKKVLLTEDQYYKQFSEMMNGALNEIN